MGIVHRSQGSLKPCAADLKSEAAIVAELAQSTLGSRSRIDWQSWVNNYDCIRDAIEQTIPGFENFNQRVRQPGGFYLPNCNRDGKFDTPDGRAKFSINRMPDVNLADDEFMMFTIRSHDQFNTTIYGLNDRYRGIHNERRVVLVNRDDMQRLGLVEKQLVDLQSQYKGQTRRANGFLVVPYDTPRQSVVTYFPEGNALVPLDQQARISKTPASKSVVVKILPRIEH